MPIDTCRGVLSPILQVIQCFMYFIFSFVGYPASIVVVWGVNWAQIVLAGGHDASRHGFQQHNPNFSSSWEDL
jgi:hypothetical protein